MNIIADKLRQAYHNDLTDCPILIDGAEEIDAQAATIGRLTREKEEILTDYRTMLNAETERRKAAEAALAKAQQERDEWKACFDKLVEHHDSQGQLVLDLERSEESLTAELAKAREALTPSAETKIAYMSEFEFRINDSDGYSRPVTVPWITIKEIMNAIASRAALSPAKTEARPSLPASAKWCQPGDMQDQRRYLVRFDDPDCNESVFTDWDAARAFYCRATLSWDCWLFAAVPASELSPAKTEDKT